MIALVACLAAAADVDLAVERAQVANDEGRYLDARALVAPYLTDPAPGSWPVHLVYLDAADKAGLDYESRAVYDALSITDKRAAAVWKWHQVGSGTEDPGALGDLAVDVPDVASLALGWLAYGQGQNGMAVAFASQLRTPEGWDLAIRASLAAGDPKMAATWAETAIAAAPDRPDALSGLWSGPSNAKIRDLRAVQLAAAVASALQSVDPTVVYRARYLAIAASDDADAVRLAEHLVELGETRPRLDRSPWSPAMVDVIGGSLIGKPLADWPAMTDPEKRTIAHKVAMALEDAGKLTDAIALLTSVRAVVDDADLATLYARMVLTADDAARAMTIADDAARMAALPANDDAGRRDEARLARQLAAAHATRGGALMKLQRGDQAMIELAIASALEPSGGWDAARMRFVGQGDRPRSPDLAASPTEATARLALMYAATARSPLAAGSPDRDVLAHALLILARAAHDRGESPLVLATEAALLGQGEIAGAAWTLRADELHHLGLNDAEFTARSHPGATSPPGAQAGVWTFAAVPGLASTWTNAAAYAAEVKTSPAIIATADGPVRIGGNLPKFQMKAEDHMVSDADLRGTVVIVMFFASWCHPCMEELPAVAKIAAKMQADGEKVEFLAVSTDEDVPSYEKIARRADLAALTFTWSPDLAGAFAVDGIPDTWIADADGILRFHHVGYGTGSEIRVEREARSLLR